MIALHTRALCDECCIAPAVVQVGDTFFLCASCEATLVDSISSAVPAAGESATVAVLASPPAMASAIVANNSIPMRSMAFPPGASATGDAFVASPLSFDDSELEAAVRALELKWLRAGIIMNAMTFNVMQDSLSIASASFDIFNSKSVTSGV